MLVASPQLPARPPNPKIEIGVLDAKTTGKQKKTQNKSQEVENSKMEGLDHLGMPNPRPQKTLR
jgi:hypothetical protein